MVFIVHFSNRESTAEVVKKEFEKMHEKIKPIYLRSLIYAIISAPLFSFSVVNMYYLLFNLEGNYTVGLPLTLFSLIAAFSVALFVEALHKNKEIKKASIEYVKDRIILSRYMDDDRKEDYLKKVESNPKDAFKTFVEFLIHEDRIKYNNLEGEAKSDQ